MLTVVLVISQVSEFIFCFFETNNQSLLLATIAGIWLAPVFVVIFILNITGLPKVSRGFYLLAGLFIVTLIVNYGSITDSCSLLALGLEYPSQWLFSYLSFIFLIISAIRLNFSFKNITDSVEIKKRRVVLYSIILALFFTLVSVLLLGEGTSFLESILAKAFVFVSLGISFFIIREKYKSE